MFDVEKGCICEERQTGISAGEHAYRQQQKAGWARYSIYEEYHGNAYDPNGRDGLTKR
jgi:hypothetical protein